MKKNKLLLVIGLILIGTTIVFAAGSDYVIRQNNLRFGRPADSTTNKCVVFDNGLGATSRKICYDATAQQVKVSQDGTNLFPIGAGGGGGGAQWILDPDNYPTEVYENYDMVLKFAPSLTQYAYMIVKVPQSYAAGSQINMYLPIYSPSASNTILMQTVSYLVRKNTDGMTSTTNSRTSTNSALTNTLANMYRQTTIDITDSAGKINSVSVSGGDIIKVRLQRGTCTDTAPIRVVQDGTEITFM